MEGGSHNHLGWSRSRPDEQDLNLKEWHLRARISRENTLSRRYSASYIRSFREDSRSFRSNFTISSTASSPGYLLKDEIDPATYSFTTALKALQARSGYVWEWLSPDEGVALNSKWDEAERYICNPLSGQVPMECLSSKTLSGRSFRSSMTARVTMSAPLVFSQNFKKTNNNNNNYKSITKNNIISNNNIKSPAVSASSVSVIKEKLHKAQFPPQEEKQEGMSKTRDVGTQSTPPPEEESSSSLSPASTPSIQEREIRRGGEDTEDGDAQNSSSSTTMKPVDDECMMQVEVKVTREEEETKRRTKEGGKNKNMNKKKTGHLCFCRQTCGCFLLSSLRALWMTKKAQREAQTTPPPNPKLNEIVYLK